MALPPGSRLPPAAQTLLWALRPVQFMESCRRRHGERFTVRLAQAGTFVFVTDPEAIRAALAGDPERARAGEANAPLAPVLGPSSILLLDGAEHLRQRRLMLPAFHGERLEGYRRLIAAVADRSLDRWPLGRELALHPRMQRIALEVILRVVLGAAPGARLERLGRLLGRLVGVAASPVAMVPWLRRDLGPPSPWARFRRALAEADAALLDEIRRARRDPALDARDDMLAALLRARDEDGEPMTERELRDALVTLVVAGHETTATALAWAFERLLRHPAALARLTAEARSGEGRDAYAGAVVDETLRLHPPIPVVARALHAPLEVDGLRLPPGVRVAPCVYLAHRRPEAYPEPDAFRPERFLDSRPDTYAWIPFGGGVRRCLGASFAVLEMRTVLQRVLARARLRAADPADEGVRRRAIVLAPSRGARAVLEERLPA